MTAVQVTQPQRLDQALGLPARTLAALCAAGRVRVRLPGEALGRAVLVGRPHLSPGATAWVLPADAAPGHLGEDLPLHVLYDDGEILAVVKPAGVAMCPDAHHPAGTLANALRGLGGPLSALEGPDRPGIVHRLDLGTSGALVVARTDAAHRALAQQFRAHTVHRRYLAVVLGQPEWTEREVTSHLGRRHPGRKRKARGSVAPGHGRLSRTALRVLLQLDGAALVEALPATGRTHQIRVHLAELGHPLIGDTLYGGARARHAAYLRGLRRPALHAAELSVDHPADGARRRFVAPLPDDLRGLLPDDLRGLLPDDLRPL